VDLLTDQLAVHGRDEQLAVVEQLMVSYGAIAYLAGDYPRCSRLFAWVRARTLDAGRTIPSPSTYAVYRHYVALVRQALDPDAARRYREEGRAMPEADAIAYAKARPSPPT